MESRVIPCLLIEEGRLCKTVQFKSPQYVGDPLNAVRVFNDKYVDELMVLAIDATRRHTGPPFELIQDVASEAFMPMCYGGGIRDIKDMHRVFDCGVEKVLLGTIAATNPSFVREVSDVFGAQSVVVAIDVRRTRGRYVSYVESGRRKVGIDAARLAEEMERAGAGEVLLTSIDREGTGKGFDLQLISTVSSRVGIPVVANGGAASPTHLRQALESGAHAVAAGSMFVFHGPHRAVLIQYLTDGERELLALQTPTQADS